MIDHDGYTQDRIRDDSPKQWQLAAALRKPQSYVSKTERYERRLDPAEFRAWVVAMGADPVAEFGAVSGGLG